MPNAHDITRQFEKALCDYTGAPYAVAVNSCTMALTLAVAWSIRRGRLLLSRENVGWGENERPEISVPKRTYVSVPMAIIHAGGRPVFDDREWRGLYNLKPLPVWDSARHFTSGMYGDHDVEFGPDTFMCVSFHAAKILGDTQGGAILHDNEAADEWFRRARFDGRAEGVAPKDDKDIIIGWHCYMSPDVSARLLNKLHFLPQHNEPLPNDAYPDLSTLECFK